MDQCAPTGSRLHSRGAVCRRSHLRPDCSLGSCLPSGRLSLGARTRLLRREGPRPTTRKRVPAAGRGAEPRGSDRWGPARRLTGRHALGAARRPSGGFAARATWPGNTAPDLCRSSTLTLAPRRPSTPGVGLALSSSPRRYAIPLAFDADGCTAWKLPARYPYRDRARARQRAPAMVPAQLPWAHRDPFDRRARPGCAPAPRLTPSPA